MIKFENYDVWGFEHALRGMRNPLESWEKTDSHYAYQEYETDNDWYFKCFAGKGNRDYIIGPYNLALAQRLIQAGPEHRKFLRQIMVSVDITAPLYWWKEFDTYKVGTVANSCSTMHTIHMKEFYLGDFSCEHLYSDELDFFKEIVDRLNGLRELYLESKNKDDWWQLIQLLPSSYNQRRTVTLNYENLRSMYFQRRNHKLDEWRIGFCSWVEDLPHSEELIMFEPKEDEDGAS